MKKVLLSLMVVAMLVGASWAAIPPPQQPQPPPPPPPPFVDQAYQAPLLINVQGILTEDNGQPITGAQSLTFILYSSPTGGTPRWTQVKNVSPDQNGFFNAVIGDSNLPEFINRSSYYLGITIGSDPEMLPLQRLVSVPYAITARNLRGKTFDIFEPSDKFTETGKDADSGRVWIQYIGAPHLILSDKDDPPQIEFRQTDLLGKEGSPKWKTTFGMAQGLSNNMILSGDKNSIDLLIEADTDNSGEGDQPSITFSQDDGAVQGKIGYFDSSNDLSLYNVYNGRLTLGTNNNKDLMVIKGEKVGIGTTDPWNRLHVKGAVDWTDSFIYIESPANQDSGIRFYEGSNAKGHLYHDASDNALRFDYDGHSNMLVLRHTGNVGIGTPTPYEKLYVQGNIKATGQLKANGSLVVNGTLWAKGMTRRDDAADFGWRGVWIGSNGELYWGGNPSDRRLKANIQPLEEGVLDKLLQIRGTRFVWKSDEKKKPQIGVIAQDVQAVFPELVHTDDDGYLGLKRDWSDALVVEAIRELKAENDELRRRLMQLEAKVNK